MNAAEWFSQGMDLYRHQRYGEAVSSFAGVSCETGLMGRLGRYYQGKACQQAGLSLARAGQLATAEDYLRRTIDPIGGKADICFYLAKTYTEVGMHERAEAQLDVAGDIRAADANVSIALARAHIRNGNPAKALLTLHATLCKCGPSVQVHLPIGLILHGFRKKDFTSDWPGPTGRETSGSGHWKLTHNTPAKEAMKRLAA